MSLLTSSHDCTGDRRLVVMASYKMNTFCFLTIMIFKSLPDAEQPFIVSVQYGRDASQLEGYSNNLIPLKYVLAKCKALTTFKITESEVVRENLKLRPCPIDLAIFPNRRGN